SSAPLTPANGNALGVRSVATWPATRSEQPRFSSTNGAHSAGSRVAGTPFRVATTFDETPTIIAERNPTVIAWRVAPNHACEKPSPRSARESCVAQTLARD